MKDMGLEVKKKKNHSSVDLIDQLPEENDEDTLLEKLGIREKQKMSTNGKKYKHKEMTQEEKEKLAKVEAEMAENKIKADKMIADAKAKLEAIKKKSADAV